VRNSLLDELGDYVCWMENTVDQVRYRGLIYTEEPSLRPVVFRLNCFRAETSRQTQSAQYINANVNELHHTWLFGSGRLLRSPREYEKDYCDDCRGGKRRERLFIRTGVVEDQTCSDCADCLPATHERLSCTSDRAE